MMMGFQCQRGVIVMKKSNELVKEIKRMSFYNDSRTFNLNDYDINQETLAVVLKEIKHANLDYKLKQTSTGEWQLKVYKRMELPKTLRIALAVILLLPTAFVVYSLRGLMLILYPIYYLASLLLDGRGCTTEEYLKDILGYDE